MEKNITINKINIADLEALRKISIDTFRTAFAWGNTEEDLNAYMNNAFSEETLAGEINDPNSFFYFACIENQPVGYLRLNVKNAQSDLQAENGLEVSRIYIDQHYQGNGIGKVLLDKALETAEERKVDFIWLGVWEKNPGAIRFYERNGFVKFSTHPFMLGTDKQTDILMKRMIDY